MQITGPLLCLNGHITVKHMLQQEHTPSWCNTEGCEWYWGTQENNPTPQTISFSSTAPDNLYCIEVDRELEDKFVGWWERKTKPTEAEVIKWLSEVHYIDDDPDFCRYKIYMVKQGV